MLVLEIPYVSGDATWRIDGLADGGMDFGSRVNALAFAMEAAQQHAHAHETARICVQGADGTWRTFDETMVPVPLIQPR